MSDDNKPGKKLSSPDIKILAESRQDLVFLPSPAHRRAKSKFWARYSGLGATPGKAEVAALTGESGINRWWGLAGFKEWFLNQDETRERLEYLYQVALDAAEQILLDPEANPSARVNMVKVVAQLAGKDKVQEAQNDGLPSDPEKLRAYIVQGFEKLKLKPDSGE